jgi:enterobactin synthetase component D
LITTFAEGLASVLGSPAASSSPLEDMREMPASEIFANLFPRPVAAVAVRLTQEAYAMFPEEEAAVVKAVAKRRIEFAAGRHCARLAMAQLGIAPRALLRGADRAPVWPDGIVGSITHSTGLCAALAALKRDYRSLGIDMEPVGAVDPELARDVLCAHELACVEDTDWPTLAFCLKEAAYKAFFPQVRKLIGFHDMRLAVAPHDRSFRAFPRIADAVPLEGRYCVAEGFIHAASWWDHGAG